MEDGERLVVRNGAQPLQQRQLAAATALAKAEEVTQRVPQSKSGLEIVRDCMRPVDDPVVHERRQVAPRCRHEAVGTGKAAIALDELVLAVALAAMLRDAAYMKTLSKAFIVVPTASDGARRLVERAGFKYERSCVRHFHAS